MTGEKVKIAGNRDDDLLRLPDDRQPENRSSSLYLSESHFTCADLSAPFYRLKIWRD